jgi:hypothetical protein
MNTCEVCREGAGAAGQKHCAACADRIAAFNSGAGASYIPMKTVDVRSIWPTYVDGAVAVSLDGKTRGITIDDAKHVADHILAERVTLQ